MSEMETERFNSTTLPSLDIKSICQESEKYYPYFNGAAIPVRSSRSKHISHLKEFRNQASRLDIYPLSCKENCEGNYDKYLEITLSHIAQMKKLKFEYGLEDPNLYKNLPNFSNFSEKKILLLDLDETLIHADFDGEFENDKNIKYDTIIKFLSHSNEKIDKNGGKLRLSENENEEISVGIFIRNGVYEFLSEVSKFFDVGIFTASVKEYADAVINFLDPENKFIKFRLYRNNCIRFNDCFSVKDLRILKNVDLKNIILIDNSMYSFAAQLTNGILINSFYENKNDCELFNVLGYLINFILPAEDVREVNEKFFNFQKILNDLKCEINDNNILL